LYLIATPIGNLGDLSTRASDHLEQADLIACEDTRVTGRLLDKLSLNVPLLSYREENERTLASYGDGVNKTGKLSPLSFNWLLIP
jgi:16S rRNA (cytidine1402-2'-O)-methyltransferase